MTQQQQENSLHRIDGYFLPRPGETFQDSFIRAREELIVNLTKDIALAQEITQAQFHCFKNN